MKKKHKVTRNTIRNIAKEHGLKVTGDFRDIVKANKLNKLKESLLEMRDAGIEIPEIMKKTGLSHSTIYRLLKECGALQPMDSRLSYRMQSADEAIDPIKSKLWNLAFFGPAARPSQIVA